MIVKAGDTHQISWKANMDLTGATVRVIAKKGTAPAIELDAAVTNPVEGLVTHQLTGTLPTGTYSVELEVNTAGEVITFPNGSYATLVVIPDLD